MSRRTDKPAHRPSETASIEAVSQSAAVAAGKAAPVAALDSGSIVLEQDQAEILVETACQLQELMLTLITAAEAQDDLELLRAHVRGVGFACKELARSIAWAVGDPKGHDWATQHMMVRGKFPDLKEQGQ